MKKITAITMPLLLLVCFGFGAAMAKGKNSRRASFFAGTWSGLGYQLGGSTWSMALTADMRRKKVSIAYPSLSCGGHWELLSVGNHIIWFKERITYGEGCVDRGKVAITRVDDRHVTFTYFFPDGQLGAYSTMVRTAAEKPLRQPQKSR